MKKLLLPALLLLVCSGCAFGPGKTAMVNEYSGALRWRYERGELGGFPPPDDPPYGMIGGKNVLGNYGRIGPWESYKAPR
jgi:hypothetical protein